MQGFKEQENPQDNKKLKSDHLFHQLQVLKYEQAFSIVTSFRESDLQDTTSSDSLRRQEVQPLSELEGEVTGKSKRQEIQEVFDR